MGSVHRMVTALDGKHTGQSANGVQVGRLSLTEDEGGRDIISGRVGDGVGGASNHTRSGVLVDLEGSNEGSESRRGDDSLEEAHVGGLEVVDV